MYKGDFNMKTWKKLALTCTLGMGVFFGVDGMVLPTYHFISSYICG